MQTYIYKAYFIKPWSCLLGLPGGKGGVLLIMASTGRPRPKGAPFSGLIVFERIGILRVEVFERLRNTVCLAILHRRASPRV